MTDEENRTRLVAETAGLARLEEKHRAQLRLAIASARELGAKLPKDLHWGEESALVFRLRSPEGGKP